MFQIFKKTLRDKRVFIYGWSLGLIVMAIFMVILFPSFSGGEVDQLVEALPAFFDGFMGNLQDWRQLPGYIGSQLYDIRLPMLLSVLAIMLPLSISVAEEEKGQLRTLLSLPYYRRTVFWGKWLAIISISLIAALSTLIGVWIGVMLIDESLASDVYARFGLYSWLVTMTMASVTFAVGMATGSRSAALGVGIIATVGSFLLTTFAQAVDWLEPYTWLSILHYFPAADVAKGVMNWSDIVVLAAVTILPIVIASFIFGRRDISAA